jgi:hypothetical protein
MSSHTLTYAWEYLIFFKQKSIWIDDYVDIPPEFYNIIDINCK